MSEAPERAGAARTFASLASRDGIPQVTLSASPEVARVGDPSPASSLRHMRLLNSRNPNILSMLIWRLLDLPRGILQIPVRHAQGFVVLVSRTFFSSLSVPALPSADSSVPYPSEGLHIDSGQDRELRMGRMRECFVYLLPASLDPVHGVAHFS